MNILEFDNLKAHSEDARAAAVRKYLTTNGWKHTSSHPGSYWMWSFDKVIESEQFDDDGTLIVKHQNVTTYVVNESTALGFQRYWELEGQGFHDPECPIFDTFEWGDCSCIASTEDDLAALEGEE